MKSRPDDLAPSEPDDRGVKSISRPQGSHRRRYEKPRVIDHGRLADIALGGSPGAGDSGNVNIQRPDLT